MKKKICMILIAVFVAVLGTSTYFIIDHYKESDKQAELYGELAELVDAAAQADAATEPAEQIPYSEEKMLLPELAELYQQNGDLVGWISIADTNINYPVMQSVNSLRLDDYLLHMLSILSERAERNKGFEVDDLLPWSEEMKSWFSRCACWEPRLFLYRGMIERFPFFSKQNRNKSTRSKLRRGA